MNGLCLNNVFLRLLLSVVAGCVLGFGRTQRGRVAGMRTYVITALGACLAMLLAEYDHVMIQTAWNWAASVPGNKFDGSRYASMVIAGVGFLSAGSIVSIEYHRVNGLTTATGLFASACVGIACGAGFWLLVVIVALPMVYGMEHTHVLEYRFKRLVRNATIRVEFCREGGCAHNLGRLTAFLEERGDKVFETSMEDRYTAMVFLRVNGKNRSMSSLYSDLVSQEYIYSVEEMVS